MSFAPAVQPVLATCLLRLPAVHKESRNEDGGGQGQQLGAGRRRFHMGSWCSVGSSVYG